MQLLIHDACAYPIDKHYIYLSLISYNILQLQLVINDIFQITHLHASLFPKLFGNIFNSMYEFSPIIHNVFLRLQTLWFTNRYAIHIIW